MQLGKHLLSFHETQVSVLAGVLNSTVINCNSLPAALFIPQFTSNAVSHYQNCSTQQSQAFGGGADRESDPQTFEFFGLGQEDVVRLNRRAWYETKTPEVSASQFLFFFLHRLCFWFSHRCGSPTWWHLFAGKSPATFLYMTLVQLSEINLKSMNNVNSIWKLFWKFYFQKFPMLITKIFNWSQQKGSTVIPLKSPWRASKCSFWLLWNESRIYASKSFSSNNLEAIRFWRLAGRLFFFILVVFVVLFFFELKR